MFSKCGEGDPGLMERMKWQAALVFHTGLCFLLKFRLYLGQEFLT